MLQRFWLVLLGMVCLITSNPLIADDAEYLLIIDCSGSMAQGMEQSSRIAIAKESAINLLNDIPDGTKLGLRAYAHRYEDNVNSCKDTELLFPISKVNAQNRKFMKQKIAQLTCKGWTPIAYSLGEAAKDFTEGDVERIVILLSDGVETCGGDPVSVAKSLNGSSSFRLVTNVIGFGVDQKTEIQLQQIAKAGGGEYFGANNEIALQQSLEKAVSKGPALTNAFHQKYMKDNWDPVKDFINTSWSEGYWLTDMLFDGNHYMAVVTKGVPYSDQRYIWGTWDDVTAYIKEYWAKGFWITHMTYDNNYYFAILSKTDYIDQNYRWDKWDGVKDYINDQWAKGYFITTLFYSEGGYLVVASKVPGFSGQRYSWEKGWDKFTDYAKQSWEENFAITGLAYDGSTNMLAVTGETGISYQYYVWGTWDEIVAYIQEGWDSGLLITSITPGDGQYGLVMSAGAYGSNGGKMALGLNQGGNSGDPKSNPTSTNNGKSSLTITQFAFEPSKDSFNATFTIHAKNFQGKKLRCTAGMKDLGNNSRQQDVTPDSNNYTYNVTINVPVLGLKITSGAAYDAYIFVEESVGISLDKKAGTVTWTIGKSVGAIAHAIRVSNWHTDVNNIRMEAKGRAGEKMKIVFETSTGHKHTEYGTVNGNHELFIPSVRVTGAANATWVTIKVYGQDGSFLNEAKWPK